MYSEWNDLLNDIRHYATSDKANTYSKKALRIYNNSGMKIVLLNRLLKLTRRNKIFFPVTFLLKILYRCLSLCYGIELPLQCKFGVNLRIIHCIGVVINPNAKIGNNVIIMQGVTLGNTITGEECPVIGNNVLIGAGAKVLGNIYIADGVRVGANAVVIKSITIPDSTVVGVPARIVR